MFRFIAALVIAAAASVAHAFAPENGLWIADAELDGKPGRGFQFDVQGSTMVLTFYGYRADGKATWYQASGPVVANAFTASLEQFEGGTAFGLGKVSAHGVGTAGNVVLSFSSAYKGTITLPGEAAKPISWYNFGRPTDPTALFGTYTLERVIAALPDGSLIDSASNMTATGTMTSDGTTVVQTVRIIVNGVTTPVSITGKLTADNGTSMTLLANNGVTSAPRAIRAGDLLTMITLSADGTVETDVWRRSSVNVQRAAGAGSSQAALGLGAASVLAQRR